MPPSGRRPSGPSLPGDRTGGPASVRGDAVGDVHDGVRAWLANAGIEVPAEPADPAATPVDPVSSGPVEDQEAVARKILLDTLTGQARSRQELADKLAKRGVPDELAAGLLDRFAEVGLIDDAAYARQWVESRHRSRGLAPRALAQELRRKGIDDEDSKAALEQIDEADQRAAARALVDKKLRSMRGLDHQVATRRLAGLLARKGYAAGLAFSVVREALGEVEDDEGHPDF